MDTITITELDRRFEFRGYPIPSLGNRLPLLSVRVHVEPGTSLRAIATLTESKGRGLDNRRDIRKSYYVLASFYARPSVFPAISREKENKKPTVKSLTMTQVRKPYPYSK